MTSAVSILPDPQLEALNAAYRAAVARKRLQMAIASVLALAALAMACIGAEVNLHTFAAKLGNFTSYFDRIFALDSGARVWTDAGEWFWGWKNWLSLLWETVLISYVGTLAGAVIA